MTLTDEQIMELADDWEVHGYGRDTIGFARAIERALLTSTEDTRGARWISVEERLPPEYVPVLTYGGKRMQWVSAARYSERDGWEIETPSEWHSTYPPKHWMPLPAPPTTGAPNAEG